MKPLSHRLWLMAALAGATAPGCGTLWHGRTPYSEDPLLLSRKPIMGKPEEAKPHQLACAEPSLPSLPAFAYVYPPRGSKILADDSALAKARPAEPAPAPAIADQPGTHRAGQVAVETSNPRVPAVPVLRHKTPQRYGHAPDCSWLQGVIRKSPKGNWELIFSESPDGAPYGGSVVLSDDPGLGDLKDGDTIRVEGTLRSMVPYQDALGEPSPPVYEVERLEKIR